MASAGNPEAKAQLSPPFCLSILRPFRFLNSGRSRDFSYFKVQQQTCNVSVFQAYEVPLL